jgi:hypothetical protein
VANGTRLTAFDTTGLTDEVPVITQLTDDMDDRCGTLAFMRAPTIVEDDHLLVGCGSLYAVAIFDITDPSEPILGGTVVAPGTVLHTAVSGSTALAATTDGAIHEIDLTDIDAPTLLGTQYLSDDAEALGVRAGYVYAATGNELAWYPIGGSQPSFLASYEAPRDVRDLSWNDGGLALGASIDSQILDAQDPTQLSWRATLPSASTSDIQLQDDWVYAANLWDGIAIIDVSDPSAPVVVGNAGLDQGYEVGPFQVVDDTLYMTTGSDGMVTYDLTDRSAPTILGSYPALPMRGEILVWDGLCAMASIDYQLDLVDVADPAQPTFLGSSSVTTPQSNLARSGSYLYLGTAGSVQRWDVTDPTQLADATPIDVAAIPTALDVQGPHMWVGLGSRGVSLLDVSDPSDPITLAQYGSRDEVSDLAVTPEHVLIADGPFVHTVPRQNASWLQPQLEVGPPGTEQAWDLTWALPAESADIDCAVSDGACTITDLDPSAGEATIVWTLPETAGDHELAVLIGDSTTYSILRDRVTVTP